MRCRATGCWRRPDPRASAAPTVAHVPSPAAGRVACGSRPTGRSCVWTGGPRGEGRPISSPIVTTTPDTGSNAGSIVVLVSGSGTNLQALIDATADSAYGVRIAAVGADRDDIEALSRARRAQIPTFVCRVADFATRAQWDAALTLQVAAYSPSLVVLAGFMKLTGEVFLGEFGGRTVNTHPALLPSFPGMRAPEEALDYGVKVTGCTLFVVDAGVDTGPVVAQSAVGVDDDDTVETLHERIKTAERQMLVDYVGRMVREGFTVTERKVTIPVSYTHLRAHETDSYLVCRL